MVIIVVTIIVIIIITIYIICIYICMYASILSEMYVRVYNENIYVRTMRRVKLARAFISHEPFAS